MMCLSVQRLSIYSVEAVGDILVYLSIIKMGEEGKEVYGLHSFLPYSAPSSIKKSLGEISYYMP